MEVQSLIGREEGVAKFRTCRKAEREDKLAMVDVGRIIIAKCPVQVQLYYHKEMRLVQYEWFLELFPPHQHLVQYSAGYLRPVIRIQRLIRDKPGKTNVEKNSYSSRTLTSIAIP